MIDTGEHDPQREIRNTREAKDDETMHFLPPRAVADLIEHALPDLRRARDRIQFVPHNRKIAGAIAELETMMALLRTERHY